MNLLFWKPRTESKYQEVSEEHPLPVSIPENGQVLPPVAGQAITRRILIPGIGTASAYTDGDAFGTTFFIPSLFRPEKRSGVAVKVLLCDKDDEGFQVDLNFFSRAITATTDNSPFTPNDIDLADAWEGTISVSNFYNWAVNQGGQNVDSRLWLNSETTGIWCQCTARGALNIAAGAEPWIKLTVVPN